MSGSLADGRLSLERCEHCAGRRVQPVVSPGMRFNTTVSWANVR